MGKRCDTRGLGLCVSHHVNARNLVRNCNDLNDMELRLRDARGEHTHTHSAVLFPALAL